MRHKGQLKQTQEEFNIKMLQDEINEKNKNTETELRDLLLNYDFETKLELYLDENITLDIKSKYYNRTYKEIMVAVCDKITVKLWNIETGTLMRTITEHSENVFAVKFSLDGRFLVSSGADKSIRIFEKDDIDEIEELFGDIKNAASTQ